MTAVEVPPLHWDQLGSVRAVTTFKPLTGQPVANRRVEAAIYKPFGEMTEVLQPKQVNPEQKGWIGERYDADAGLQYLNARYYDPEYGFFLQPDWFGVTAAGVGTNRYSYSFNDPVNKMDPGGNRTNDQIGFFERLFLGAMEMATNAFASNVLGGRSDRYAAVDAMAEAGQDIQYAASAFDFAAGGAVGKGGRRLGKSLEWLAVKLGGSASRFQKRTVTVFADSPATPPPAEVTTVFRAVGVNEYNEVMATGAFRLGAGGFDTGKQFGLNPQETLTFSNHFKDIVGIFRVEVPTKILDGIADRTHVESFIFKSGTITVPADRLSEFNNCVICISDALE